MSVQVKNKDKIIEISEMTFKLGFMLYSMLSFCSFTYGTKIISIVLWPILLLGLFLCLWRVIHIKMFLNVPGFCFLVLFALSYVVSLLVNIKYGYKDGIIKWIFLCFYFFLYYSYPKEIKRERQRRDFKVLSLFYLFYIGIGSIISLSLMFIGYYKVYTIENGWDIGLGLVWGRLWGIFSEPNYAAVCLVIAIILSVYYIKITNKRVLKVLLGINILCALLHLSFTDSRTGVVSLAIMMSVYTFNLLNRKRICKSESIKKSICPLIVAILVMIITAAIPSVIVGGYNLTHKIIVDIKHEEMSHGEIDRGYSLESDPSNRRFSIWKAGLEIFETSPVVGVSFSNVLAYTRENYPDSYLLNNSKGTNFSSIHNEVLNVLVGQGILGVSILLGYIIYLIKLLINGFYIGTDVEFQYKNMLFSGLAAIMAGAMFLTGMFYSNLPNAIMFWCILSELVYEILYERKVYT